MSKSFNIEKELLILLARVTFTEKEIARIEEIKKENISWCEFFKYAMKNKVLGLVWSNIVKFEIKHIPKYIKKNLEFIAEGQRQQTLNYLEERNMILERLSEKGKVVVPVKGAMLIDLLYPDLSQRALGDLDFLIKKEDETIIAKVMEELGYVKGTYDAVNNRINPVERQEDISWKLGATNVYPFLKISDNVYTKFFKIDFRHSIGKDINPKPIGEIVDTYIQKGYVQPAHIIAHLATHLYHEATHTMAVLYNKDINLIKFCDIREYCLKFLKEKEIDELIYFAKNYGIEDAIYYTFFYLKELYADGYEDSILKKIPADKECVKYYYDDATGSKFEWKKSFFERMFASDNFDELEKVEYEINKTF